MRRWKELFRSQLEIAVVVIPVVLLVLGAAFWMESSETSAQQETTSLTAMGFAPSEPAAPPARSLFQSPPAPPGVPSGQPPAPGIGTSPAGPGTTVPGQPTATPIPDEVVLDLANNPVFIGVVLLVILAILGGFIWFWTSQNRGR